jgi:hypothetical protein
MNVIDLFCGLKGWSEPFLERGHEVITLDIDPKFHPDIVADILEVEPEDFPWRPDAILASPPCEAFSVLRIGRNWTGPDDPNPHSPKTPEAAHAVKLVEKTINLIEQMSPRFFVIENPRAKLRKLPMMARFDRVTVTYCQYGLKYMKPTDLWGGFPKSWAPRPICSNGDPCHVRAPRGSLTGVQSRTPSEIKAKIPRELALEICLAMERDLSVG